MSDSHGTIMEILSWSKLSEGSHCLKQSRMVLGPTNYFAREAHL
ncbi:predicted protein [Botrytis cinerea T4]|uniref:Uncharacterized protein n=1 Tax=Botryotinia fuckeliana (strain T4) TaxID=999810 RepID=G2YSD8_BOTF4|nr:predicted protein [Botrytis cinerea T4]